MEQKKNDDFEVWVVVIIVIIFIVAYVLSLGKIKIPQKTIVPEEFKDTQAQAKQRYERLKNLIDKKIELKGRLNKWFKRIYFGVRLFFLTVWGLYLYILYKFNLIQNLGDALNYSEVAILAGVAINFLTFGSLSNLNNFIDLIKIRLKNWLWGKYMRIEESIEVNVAELKETENCLAFAPEIKQLNQ